MKPIPLGEPYIPDSAIDYLKDSIGTGRFAGDNAYTKLCHTWLEQNTQCNRALLTPSCTHALELAGLLANIKEGDEVIMPSFTFSSTANAFVLRGAKIVFIDIRPDTMNIDENKIEAAITERTVAIVPVHYAGVGAEMDKIMKVAKTHDLYVIEDAAQGLMAKYRGKALGSFGEFGCFSFHDTKNYTSGEGGALLINDMEHVKRAEIVREKGTNRAAFFRGDVDKYSWVDVGSSYLPSDLNSALLWAQLEIGQEMNSRRLEHWNRYYRNLAPFIDREEFDLPHIPEHCSHNAHIFFIKVRDLDQRTKLNSYLRENKIGAAFHYVPLHSSIAGKKFGRFHGDDVYTTKESERLLRLPLYFRMTEAQIDMVCEKILAFPGLKLQRHHNGKEL